MHRDSIHDFAQHSSGFSMIEILISLIILSIALLGIAEIQVKGLRTVQEANYHISAAMLANDIAERIRSNQVEAKKGPESVYQDPTGTKGTETDWRDCTATTATFWSCRPNKLAGADLYDWRETIKNFLPEGTGKVCLAPSITTQECDTNTTKGSTTQTMFAVIIKWYIRGNLETYKMTFYP